MARAIELAARGRGSVEPNPMVGCVIVRNQQVIAEGWHELYGGPHAEVNAILAAKRRGHGPSFAADTLYVTLEPCCHFGKTPPCVDQILEAGFRRVVVAMRDPFPAVQGGGFARLRDAGIDVDVGVGEEAASELNAPYLHLIQKRTPWVIGKWAMTLDGKIATRTGDSRWISNERSRSVVHEWRGRMDAIVVGRGTVEHDDPQLTARPPGPRVPTRVILATRGRLPLDCTLVRTAREVPVLVVVGPQATAEDCQPLADAGCEVLALKSDDRVEQLREMLLQFGTRRWTNLLVEGGSRVLGSFLDGRLLNEAHVFVAPVLLGGADAKVPTAGQGIATIAEALRFKTVSCECLDGDIYIRGRHPKSNGATAAGTPTA